MLVGLVRSFMNPPVPSSWLATKLPKVPQPKDMPIGFGPVEVKPGETVTLSAVAQWAFKGRKLIVTQDSVQLYFEEISVDGKRQLPTTHGPITCEAFSTQMKDNDIHMTVCPADGNITIKVKNYGTETATFSAALWGKAAVG